MKFGDIYQRYDDIVADAELTGKDREILIRTYDELFANCETAISSHESLNDSHSSSRGKAIMTTYRGIEKINAGSFLQRIDDLRAVNSLRGITRKEFCVSKLSFNNLMKFYLHKLNNAAKNIYIKYTFF